VAYGLIAALSLAGPLSANAVDEPPAPHGRPKTTIEGTVVDESGATVPNVRVRLHSLLPSPSTVLADRNGVFRFTVDLPSTRYLNLQADNLKDGKRGCVTILEEGTLRLPAPLRIVVKPPRELVVEVTDRSGSPVADAQVAVTELFFPIDEGQTGPDGTVRFRLAADAKVGSVIALKSGRGFDYWSDRSDHAMEPEPIPAKVSLKFGATRAARVRAVDSRGPVAGITIVPSMIWTRGRTVGARVFFSRLGGARTDANGTATFDWIPVDVARPVMFETTSPGFHYPDAATLETNPTGVADLTIRLMRCTKIAGRVLTPEGEPAAGVLLQAEGRGATNHAYRDMARTNAAGAFEFDAYPGQAYLVGVLDENWAASSRLIAELTEDVPVGGLEFRLGRGTLIRGTCVSGDGRPPEYGIVRLVQSETAGPPAPRGKVDLVRFGRTDPEGRYAFRVAPGTYQLIGPEPGQAIELTIDSQVDVVHDFRAN
jgi:hypothetical protein